MVDISVVIRTFNEERYLGELLTAINTQDLDGLTAEVVLVDSGSTDNTVAIAQKHNCRIVRISKAEFTFGRSLNLGCGEALGSYLIFISGHCVPTCSHWLMALTEPLREQGVVYCYGNQIGRDTTKFSEYQVFKKYFDPTHRTPQPDYFVNNANAALVASVWDENRFDESITGLEDMHLARRLISKGMKISYAPGAAVYHIHDESWMQVKWRYEREALALQAIDSSLHMSRRDLVSCILRSVYFDSLEAVRRGVFWATAAEIVAFRVCQYWGSYLGSRGSRKLNEAMKRRYFYPDKK